MNPEEDNEKPHHVNKVVDEDYEGLRELGEYLQRRYGRRWADPTSLIHRAYLRLVEHDRADCVSVAHARGTFAKAMRSCLIDLIRREARCVHVENGFIFAARSTDEILSVHEGLSRLTRIDPVKTQIVERRYFGGFQWDEIAEDMDMSVSTAKRKFRDAKSWLRKHLQA